MVGRTRPSARVQLAENRFCSPHLARSVRQVGPEVRDLTILERPDPLVELWTLPEPPAQFKIGHDRAPFAPIGQLFRETCSDQTR